MSDLRGLGFRHPALGVAMTLFMVSLGGIPPTAGFMGKIYVFGVALDAGLVPLVVIGVLNSVVSIFYYLRVTVAMYMEDPQGEPAPLSGGFPSAVGLGVAAALMLWWGIQGHALLEQARRSVLDLL
jgi:NADH-quinone oxidoreductase subunit N